MVYVCTAQYDSHHSQRQFTFKFKLKKFKTQFFSCTSHQPHLRCHQSHMPNGYYLRQCSLIEYFHCAALRAVLSCFSHVGLCNPKDCNSPGSFVHGILQARILEWFAVFHFKKSSQPKDQTSISYLMSPALAGGFVTTNATWEAHS